MALLVTISLGTNVEANIQATEYLQDSSLAKAISLQFPGVLKRCAGPAEAAHIVAGHLEYPSQSSATQTQAASAHRDAGCGQHEKVTRRPYFTGAYPADRSLSPTGQHTGYNTQSAD